MTALPPRPPAEVLTFGCRLNAYESDVMRSHAAAAGLADAVIVNSCAVTAEAERQVRQAIRKARREQPGKRIIVTGCAAQIDPAAFAAMPEVDQVIGNAEKLRLETFRSLASGRADRILVQDMLAPRPDEKALARPRARLEGRVRAFLQVQQGCDHRCTFCIIPYGRGPSRSLPLGAILAEAQALLAQGARELVLTGVDLTAWGADLPGRPSLGQMVRRLLALLPELARLRLSSLDPVEIDEELFRLVGEEPRLMPHLHLSLQAGDDLILKRMKRRHCRADAIAVCERLRRLRPGIALGADLIAGFPTETEAMFARTESLVEACGLAFLHVFPYSARAGTPAARMPQLPGALRKARAARLRAAGEAAQRRFLAGRLGDVLEVLVERAAGEAAFGHSAEYVPVRIAGPAAPGEILRVRAEAAEGGALLARRAA